MRRHVEQALARQLARERRVRARAVAEALRRVPAGRVARREDGAAEVASRPRRVRDGAGFVSWGLVSVLVVMRSIDRARVRAAVREQRTRAFPAARDHRERARGRRQRH